MSEKEHNHFKDELRELVKIPLIKSYHLGVPAQTPRDVVDNSYGYSLLVFFDNKEDHDAYQIHEKHDAFIENCKQYWEKVQVYDSIDF